jgi:hypothetical protein
MINVYVYTRSARSLLRRPVVVTGAERVSEILEANLTISDSAGGFSYVTLLRKGQLFGDMSYDGPTQHTGKLWITRYLHTVHRSVF